jgi:predicted permease
MNWWNRLLRKSQMEKDLQRELDDHLDRQVSENIRAGMSANEARRQAILRFGGLDRVKEECREARGVYFIATLAQDVRYGLRALRKSPGFTVVVVLTLALGIGANSAIFSLVNGVLLRPLPYLQSERLVAITKTYPEGGFVAMRPNLHTMDLAAIYEGVELNLTGHGEPKLLYGSSVSAELFSVLGVQPAMGRTFRSGEDQPSEDNVVMLSHSLWQREFGSDPNVIGRWVTLEGADRQIVGVMPADFQFASPKIELWIPLHFDPRDRSSYWGASLLHVIGRLRPGVNLNQANAEVGSFSPRILKMFPWKMPDTFFVGTNVIALQQDLVGDVQTKLFILLGAIGLVLLIACVNVANLQLARAATRQREMAVRAALGARRWRIHRQLLTESMILAAAGGAVGLLFAVNGLAWLKTILPADTPRLGSVAIDWRVLTVTAITAILAGAIFGFAPALYASRTDLTESLKTGSKNATGASHGLRNSLATMEIALAVVLVIAAGLTVRSLWRLSHVNPGFSSESIVTARITPNKDFCGNPQRCEEFYVNLLDRAGALPAVGEVALVSVLPLEGRADGFAADVEDHPTPTGVPSPMLFESVITPGYLHTMRIPLIQGRTFTPEDSSPNAPPVAIVTESTARKYWPDQNSVGKHIKPTFVDAWITIVGVAADVMEDSLASKLPRWSDGAIYVPYGNATLLGHGHVRPEPIAMTLVMRTSGSQVNYADLLPRVATSLNPDVPVSDVQTLLTVVTKSFSGSRATMTLLVMFASLALILGAVGIYGVVSYSVAQRTAEIGVRMALGAQRGDVLRLVIGQGAKLALTGIALGVVGALAVTRLIGSLLYDLSPTDPFTFIGVAVLLTLVALLASYLPARRATRVDPMIALRYE